MYGSYIRAARERAGFTREQAAARIGVSADGLYKIESDRNEARLGTLEKIAKAYQCQVGDLLPNSGGSAIADELAPIAAALAGLSRTDIRDLTLNLASQARLMANWRLQQPRGDEDHGSEQRVSGYNRGFQSGADEPEALAEIYQGSVAGEPGASSKVSATPIARREGKHKN